MLRAAGCTLDWTVVTLLGSQTHYCTSFNKERYNQLQDKHVSAAFLTSGKQTGAFHSGSTALRCVTPELNVDLNAATVMQRRKQTKINLPIEQLFTKCSSLLNFFIYYWETGILNTHKFQTCISLCKHRLGCGPLNDIKCYRQFSIPGSVWLTLFECWWDGDGRVQVARWSGWKETYSYAGPWATLVKQSTSPAHPPLSLLMTRGFADRNKHRE